MLGLGNSTASGRFLAVALVSSSRSARLRCMGSHSSNTTGTSTSINSGKCAAPSQPSHHSNQTLPRTPNTPSAAAFNVILTALSARTQPATATAGPAAPAVAVSTASTEHPSYPTPSAPPGTPPSRVPLAPWQGELPGIVRPSAPTPPESSAAAPCLRATEQAEQHPCPGDNAGFPGGLAGPGAQAPERCNARSAAATASGPHHALILVDGVPSCQHGQDPSSPSSSLLEAPPGASTATVRPQPHIPASLPSTSSSPPSPASPAPSPSTQRGSIRYHHQISLPHRRPSQPHLHSHQPHQPHSHHHHHHQHHHRHPSHPTLRLIASRLRSGSRPGARRDGAKLGLVVEGGGMRGCISGAMLMALHDLGLTDVFDTVYGASAGAINATYYLTGQRHGLAIYHEDLTQGSAFLDFRNLFSRAADRPVMNIDFLIDDVMASRKPLDWAAVLDSPTPLKIVASCLDSLQPVLLSDFADRSELAQALKATAAVPQIAGPPRVVRGRPLVDAAVFEPVPVPSAIRDGCSHVLVLCTRPAPTGLSPWATRVRNTIEVLAKTTVLNAPYMREAWRTARSPSFAGKDEELVAALRTCPHEFRRSMGAYVLPLYPEHTAGCHPLCLDPPTLRAACEVGHGTLMRALAPVVLSAAAMAGGSVGEGVAGVSPAAIAAAAEAVGSFAVGKEEIGKAEVEEIGKELVGAGLLGGGESGEAGRAGAGANGQRRAGAPSFAGAALYSAGMEMRFRP